MNFEGFKDLIQRVAAQWWQLAQREIIELDSIKKYLQDSPFLAKQTPENESAYERLMDVRCKLYVRIVLHKGLSINLMILFIKI